MLLNFIDLPVKSWSSMKFVFFISSLILAINLLCFTSSEAEEVNLSRSKLMQLALHLDVADATLQYDFAQIALLEMYNTYQYELDRSYTDPPKTAQRKKDIYSWRFGMRSYLETLASYLQLMDSGSPLHYFVSDQNKIFLMIDDVPLIVSGPNAGADKEIERNIVQLFCQQYDCREYFEQTHYAQESGELSQTLADKDIFGQWSFNSKLQAVYTVSNGLVFNFDSMKDRYKKEQWVITVSQELALIMEKLQQSKEKHIQIHWPSLFLSELPLTDKAYKLVLNQKNDFIKINLPILAQHHSLFLQLIPWIKRNFLLVNVNIDQTIITDQNIMDNVINNAQQFL